MRQHAPQIEIAGNATAVAERAAARVVARLRDRHAVTLGFATGATMRPVYARLVAVTRAGDVSFRAVSSFNLDEYVGVAPQSPEASIPTCKSICLGMLTWKPDGREFPTAWPATSPPRRRAMRR